MIANPLPERSNPVEIPNQSPMIALMALSNRASGINTPMASTVPGTP